MVPACMLKEMDIYLPLICALMMLLKGSHLIFGGVQTPEGDLVHPAECMQQLLEKKG